MKQRIKCPVCETAYRVDAARIGESGSRVTCHLCGHVWVVEKADLEASLGPESTSEPEAPDGAMDGVDLEIPAGASEPTAVDADPGPREIICPHCGRAFQDPARAGAGDEPGGRPTILLVDDKEFFREYAQEILGDAFRYITAESTTEALEKINTHDLDLIILDLKLENGPRDGHYVLTHRSKKDVPVLILTGEQNFDMLSDDWNELVELGALELVEKGMNIKEPLTKKVRGLLGRV